MSSPLAIGAVSAVLRNLLDNGLIDANPLPVGPVAVTAKAPDQIKVDDPLAPPSLNLFLHRTSLNQGWHDAGLPTYDGNGSRVANPPLALDLHYLLTAYGNADFQAEILLGYAMHLLHERPVLDRATIRKALDPSPLDASTLPPEFQALVAADLADQIEAVTVTPEPMDSEEMSRLWSATQAHFRPTASYLVSVVLIQARKPSRKPLPVLSRGVVVEPSLLPPFPTIERVVPTTGQSAARLDETVRLEGHHLDGTDATARFHHRLLDEPLEHLIGVSSDPSGIDVKLPSGNTAEEDWPAGVYTVDVTIVRPGDPEHSTSNVAAMLLAPEAEDLSAAIVARDAGTRRVSVTLDLRPQVRPAQEAKLALGGETAVAEPHPSPTSTLSFEFGDLPAGEPWLRLIVDGVESLLVDRAAQPPSFDPSQKVSVPA